MKLPGAERAFVDIGKLSGYCLNPLHERGKHKALRFFSKLGITSKNAEKLRDMLLEAAKTSDAVPGFEDQYGERYVIDFMISTEKGQANIRSIWIVLKHENFPRLASCYILKEGKK